MKKIMTMMAMASISLTMMAQEPLGFITLINLQY